MKTRPSSWMMMMIFCCLVLSGMGGCTNARELNTLAIVVGIGLDKAETPDDVAVTIQIVKPSDLKKPAGNGGGGASKAYLNINSAYPTVAESIEEYLHLTSKRIYLAHNKVFLIGRELAEEGVLKHLDYFIRHPEIRPVNQILIALDPVEELLEVDPEVERLPALGIETLALVQRAFGHSKAVNFNEFMNGIISPTGSAVLPLLQIIGQGEEKKHEMSGLAVFKKDKMVGTLNKEETRGLLWVKGDVQKGIIDVPFRDQTVSLRVRKAESKVKPALMGDQAKLTVKIKVEVALVGQTGTKKVTELETLAQMEKAMSEVIQAEITGAIAKAHALRADIFGFGSKIHQDYPRESKEMLETWEQIFPEVDIKVEVKGTILSTGLLTKPILPEGIKKKS